MTFHQRDGKTGLLTRAKEVLSAALVNRPFFRMNPVLLAAKRDPIITSEIEGDKTKMIGLDVVKRATLP